jgi:RHS repeat-associated protein
VDTNGNSLDSIVYDPWGNIISESNPANGDRFKYDGGVYDAIQQTYLFNARWLNPENSRWESVDPSGMKPDSNSYRYVLNSPTNFIDVSGFDPERPLDPYDVVKKLIDQGFVIRGKTIELKDLKSQKTEGRTAGLFGIQTNAKIDTYWTVLIKVGPVVKDSGTKSVQITDTKKVTIDVGAKGGKPIEYSGGLKVDVVKETKDTTTFKWDINNMGENVSYYILLEKTVAITPISNATGKERKAKVLYLPDFLPLYLDRIKTPEKKKC